MTQTIARPSLVSLRPKFRARLPVMGGVSPLEPVDPHAEPTEDVTPARPVNHLPSWPEARSGTRAVPAARKRVLVVDDDAAATRLVRLTLERAVNTFEVCEVNDPRQALLAARRFQPQLILLDIEMPGLNGSAVARLVREEPGLRHVPILFITSLITPEEAEANLYAAGSRVLAKPVTIAKLMQSVAEMLNNILANGNHTPAAPAAP